MSSSRTIQETKNDNEVVDYWIKKPPFEIINFFWSLRKLGIDTKHLQQIFRERSSELNVFVSIGCNEKADHKSLQKLMESSNNHDVLFHASQRDADAVRYLLTSYGDKFTIGQLGEALFYIIDRNQPDLVTLLWQLRCKAIKHYDENERMGDVGVEIDGKYVSRRVSFDLKIVPSLKKAIDKKNHHTINTILDTASTNIPFDVLQQSIHCLLKQSPETKILNIMRYLNNCGTTSTDKKHSFMQFIILELIKDTNDSSEVKIIKNELEKSEKETGFFKSLISMLWETSGSIIWNKMIQTINEKIEYLEKLSRNDAVLESAHNPGIAHNS